MRQRLAPTLFLLGLFSVPRAAAGFLHATSAAGALRGRAASSSGARQASERPGWGRDYGPALGLNRSAPDGGPCGAQSPHIRAAVPTGQPAIEWPALDVSDTDLDEHFYSAASSIADSVHHIEDYDSWAEQIVDNSCEKVCMRCVFESLSIAGRSDCRCAANCLEGPDGCACDTSVEAGWTASRVTAPTQSWRARCGGGDKDCMEDCLGKKFREAAGPCMQNMDPVSCISQVKALYTPFLESRQGLVKVYCTHKRMHSCDVLAHPPVNASRSWRCFGTWQECHDSKLPSGFHFTRESKSVWENVRIVA